MHQLLEGKLQAENLKVCVVASRFNEFITSKLLAGAKDCFIRHMGQEENFTTVWVPGSFEIPLACQEMAKMRKFDAICAIGAVIRGQTAHFDYVANEVTKGVAQVGLSFGLPVMFGVLTTDSIEQAIERAGTKNGNKGYEIMMGAIEMANLLREIKA